MKLLLDYSLPLAGAVLLLAFFWGLPDLRRCPLPKKLTDARPGLHWDALILLAIALPCALVSFRGLGDRSAPQSFVPLAGDTVTLTLPEGAAPASAMLYSGVGIGGYELDFSADGEHWDTACAFDQDHVAVLKWHALSWDAEASGRYVRLRWTYGEPWLGELVFLDESGAVIAPEACSHSALCDEQALVQTAATLENSSYFDEIYHARTAWEHLNGVWPYEISHPPLGKEIMSLGIALFGMTPFGWRFMGTLFGLLMLPVMYAFLKELFGGRWVPALGTLVFASDFMRFTQTRIATIDTYGVFFILLMYLFFYGWLRRGSRLSLALAGISFGLGAASKWTAIYAGAGLGVLWLLYWLDRFLNEDRGGQGGSSALPRVFLQNVAFCLIFFVAVPALIYYLSYLPYGRARLLAPFTREYTHMVLENQRFMFTYHAGIVAEHPYASRWYQWLLDIRPILYYLEYLPEGRHRAIAAFLNPALCWGGLLSLFVLLYAAVWRRDRKAAFLLLGYLAQLLPWVLIRRLTFAYHYFPCSVFLVLALGYVFALMREGRRRWLCWAIPFTAVSLGLFWLFYPVLSGAPMLSRYSTVFLKWLPTWPL